MDLCSVGQISGRAMKRSPILNAWPINMNFASTKAFTAARPQGTKLMPWSCRMAVFSKITAPSVT